MVFPLFAQITSFSDDFEDGIITGWSVDTDHQRTYELSESEGAMHIDYHRVASSWEWDNFNFTPPEQIDVSETPEISIRIKSSVATQITVKPIYSNGKQGWIQQNIPGNNAWDSYLFSLSAENYTGANLTMIYFYLDAGTTTPKSGIVSIDDFVVGTGEFVLKVNDLIATAKGEDTIDLDWNCNDSTVVDHYNIYRDMNEGFDCDESTMITSNEVSKYNDTGLTVNTTYYYKVIATDTAGNNTNPSNETSARTFIPGSGPSVYVENTNEISVGVYEKFEINVGLGNAIFENPYNPEEIDLRAIFTSPSDSVWVIFGFYDNYQQRDQWKVRFSPNESGNWSYSLYATDLSGTGTSDQENFTVTESSHKGWIRSSEENPHYFEHDNGETFYGIGTYNPWQMNENELDNLTSHGGNLVGFWNIMYDEGNIIESMESGLGKYDQPKCGRIDQIINWAEEKDLKAMFAIWPHDLLSNTVWVHQWHLNPYNSICSVEEFYSDLEAWEYQKKQYRYLIARWGYSRGLGIWEIVNEINGTDGWQNGYVADAEMWTQKVSNYLRENDPFKHPNTASQSGGKWWPNGYEVIDIANVHMYETQLFSAHYPSNPMRSSMYAYQYITQKFFNDFEKPGIFGEAGYENSYGGYEPGGANYTSAYHNSLWVSWACGISATPIWWDYNILSGNDLDQLLAFQSFISQNMEYLDFAHKIYEPIEVTSTVTDAFVMASDTSAFGWIRQIDGISISGISFTINGLEDLSYTINYFNTWTGELISSELLLVENGSGVAIIPPIPSNKPDVAFIIKPEEFGVTPYQLVLSANPNQLLNDGETTSTITCMVKDEEERFCANATNEITFSIIGNGTFTSASVVTSIGGISSIIFQSPTQVGTEKIFVSSAGLESDTIEIEITNQYNFDDFESYESNSDLENYWKVQGTSQARLYLEKNQIYEGEQSLKVHYNIGNGAPPYAAVYRAISKDLSQFKYLGLWYKPAGTNRQVAFRLSEKNGTNWDYYIDLEGYAGKYIEVALSDFTTSGCNCETMDLSNIDEISINILKGNGEFGEALLFFDSIRFLTTVTQVNIDLQDSKNIVTKFKLMQNYPNPFNPETNISYQINKSSNVKLQIYDLRGKIVEILVNEQKFAGQYKVIWNAEKHSSGIYVYKLISDEGVEVKKCVLLK